MRYERWVRENTSRYKGFEIRAGTIYKDGEAMVLFFAPLAATKKDGWINIYHGQHTTVSGRIVYTTEEVALANKDTSSICIATIKIEWEE